MEKKNYYTPEVKFHQLRGNAVMAAISKQGQGEDNEEPAKAFSGIFFDEDED